MGFDQITRPEPEMDSLPEPLSISNWRTVAGGIICRVAKRMPWALRSTVQASSSRIEGI